jgi:hypothetical protein
MEAKIVPKLRQYSPLLRGAIAIIEKKINTEIPQGFRIIQQS